MEQIIGLFDKFVNIYESNQIPNWLTIGCTIIMPIVLSIIVIIQNIIISKRNEKLQKDLLNNEIKIKRYDIILNAYTTYIDSLSKIPTTKEGITAMLKENEQMNKLVYDILNERDKVILETNKLRLLLKDDTDLIKIILELEKSYIEIANNLLEAYIYNKKLDIDKMLEKTDTYKKLLQYDNYDKYFEKYLFLKEFIQKT